MGELNIPLENVKTSILEWKICPAIMIKIMGGNHSCKERKFIMMRTIKMI